MELKVSLEPFENPITCTVVGSRRRFEPAPNSIQRFYNNREALMPLILEPQHGVFARRLLVGSVTKFTLFQSLGLQ